jgi:hypothetical protein
MGLPPMPRRPVGALSGDDTEPLYNTHQIWKQYRDVDERAPSRRLADGERLGAPQLAQ